MYFNLIIIHLVTMSVGGAGAYPESSDAIAAQRVSEQGGNNLVLFFEIL